MYGWEPIGRQPVFFRLRMQPVTLGHLDLLADLGIDVHEGIAPQDVATVAFICSQDYKQSRKDVGSWWCKYAFKFWGRLCGAQAFEESDQFTAWFYGQLGGPITKSKPGAKHESGAPLHENLIACCMGLLNMTEAQALDWPAKKARRRICALGEARGELSLWTRRDEMRRELSVQCGLVEPRETSRN